MSRPRDSGPSTGRVSRRVVSSRSRQPRTSSLAGSPRPLCSGLCACGSRPRRRGRGRWHLRAARAGDCPRVFELAYHVEMVRRDDDDGSQDPKPSGCASPAGASPAPVGVGAPGSRSPESGEILESEARRQKPVNNGRQGRGPQHEVKLAASTREIRLHSPPSGAREANRLMAKRERCSGSPRGS